MLGLTHVATAQHFSVPGPVTVGRSRQCEVRLFSHLVSRHHAQLYPERGGWFALDLSSKNGTLVNGNALSDVPVPLAHGDVLSIAGDTFVVTLS